MRITRLSFKSRTDVTSKNLISVVIFMKVSCGKKFSVKRTTHVQTLWYMAGTIFSNAQAVIYKKMMRHKEGCKICRKVVLSDGIKKEKA